MGRLSSKDSTPTGDASAPSWPKDEDGKPTEAWHHGGGAPWQTASFDLEKNMVVIGTPAASPWNLTQGDDPRNWPSLFTSGQTYVDASTGELRASSSTPNDAWDFSDWLNSVVLFGTGSRPASWSRPRPTPTTSGYFFSRPGLSRRRRLLKPPHSQLPQAAFVEGITWAKGWDASTSKPIRNRQPPEPSGCRRGDLLPLPGGTSPWMPMSGGHRPVLHSGQPLGHGLLDRAPDDHHKAGSAIWAPGLASKRLFDDLRGGFLRAVRSEERQDRAGEPGKKFPLAGPAPSPLRRHHRVLRADI